MVEQAGTTRDAIKLIFEISQLIFQINHAPDE